jgi:hypothetical protein
MATVIGFPWKSPPDLLPQCERFIASDKAWKKHKWRTMAGINDGHNRENAMKSNFQPLYYSRQHRKNNKKIFLMTTKLCWTNLPTPKCISNWSAD